MKLCLAGEMVLEIEVVRAGLVAKEEVFVMMKRSEILLGDGRERVGSQRW